ncbi:hypothetical protein ACFLZ4_02200, partial [Patescibacteria group bacterium]
MNIRIKLSEQKHLREVLGKLKKEQKRVEEGLGVITEDNLARLKELREGGTGSSGFGYTDFDMFLQQLSERNAAYDIKGQYKRLEELDYLLDEPYFSRIDLINPKEDKKQEIYIGKFAYTDED